jgi:hypothetical protein
VRIRSAAFVALLGLVSACSSPPKDNAGGRIMVVDARGAPLAGAFLSLLPEYENASSRPTAYTTAELRAHTSDTQGMIRVDLDDYLWDSDHNYHFRIRRGGYEDVTMSVSPDLLPPVLKIEMRRLEPEPGAPPNAARPAARPQ